MTTERAASLLQSLRNDLATAGLAPNHRLGQNFMIDAGMLSRIAAHPSVLRAQRIVEIGPGTGILTQHLLQRGVPVCAVELDRGLYHFLRERFAAAIASGMLHLIHGDALAGKNHLNAELCAWLGTAPWSLVANLPYDVSIPVLLNALTMSSPAEDCLVTVQWEAAARLTALPESKAWGASAAIAQSVGSGTIVCRLPPQCFYPRPRIDSALLAWHHQVQVDASFTLWARQVFAYRRKVLPRALRDLGHTREEAQAILTHTSLDGTRRLEQLRHDELLAVHQAARLYARSP